MQKLNRAATEIVLQLLCKTGKKYKSEFTSKGNEPLVIIRMASNAITPYGKGKTYSFYQYTPAEYDGDPMYDPEMWFLVIDNRNYATDYDNVSVYPTFYQQSELGIYQYSADPEDCTVVDAPLQAKHTLLANGWMISLQNMGFLQ